MSLIYLNKIPQSLQTDFENGVRAMALRLGVDPNWIMQVMNAETAGTMSAKIQNPTTKATGLIQFMPRTAKGLGTTVEALRQLNEVQQLPWVERYFRPYAGRMKSYYDVYAVVFFPAAIGKPDTWVLNGVDAPAARVAAQNPAINRNKDGVITVAEFKAYVKSTVPSRFQQIVFAAEQVGEAVAKKKD